MKIRLKNIVIISFIFSCAFFSCESKDQTIDFYEQKLNQLENLSSFHYVIILPGLGCQGCISGVEDYVKNNIERPDVLFILTRMESLKMLQNKIGINLRNRDNVLIDLDNEFLLTTDQSIYPIAVKLNNSKISRIDFISPKSNISLVDFLAQDD